VYISTVRTQERFSLCLSKKKSLVFFESESESAINSEREQRDLRHKKREKRRESLLRGAASVNHVAVFERVFACQIVLFLEQQQLVYSAAAQGLGWRN